jgi:hypothetical protein
VEEECKRKNITLEDHNVFLMPLEEIEDLIKIEAKRMGY